MSGNALFWNYQKPVDFLPLLRRRAATFGKLHASESFTLSLSPASWR